MVRDYKFKFVTKDSLMDNIKDLKKQITSLQRRCSNQQETINNFKKLIRINSNITSASLNREKLLNTIMRTAEKVMHSQTSSLMLIDEETDELIFEVARGKSGKKIKEKIRLKMGQGIAGWVAMHGKPLVVADVSKDARFFSKADKDSGFQTNSIICVPLKVQNKTIGVLQALNPLNKKSFSKRDLPIFKAFANLSAVAIENAKLHTYRIEQTRLRNELDIAQRIQQNILPRSNPVFKDIHCSAKNLPALSVGGDLFDFIMLKDNHLAVVIGDVSGKGIPAALYMVTMISTLRFYAQASFEPSEILKEVNRTLCEESTMGMFVTTVLLMFDMNTYTLKYANAGHIPPIKINKSKNVLKHLNKAKTPPLGIISDLEFGQETIRLAKGDIFLLYTDGITEARRTNHTEYGESRLLHAIRHTNGTPKEIVEGVLKSVKEFSKKANQHDDITLVSAGYL